VAVGTLDWEQPLFLVRSSLWSASGASTLSVAAAQRFPFRATTRAWRGTPIANPSAELRRRRVDPKVSLTNRLESKRFD
jgi:hypothetical protein